MKNKILISICLAIASLCAISLASCSTTIMNSNTIRGNKNIVTKELKIKNYESIALTGSANIFYQMKENEAPFLSIEIDENLVEYVDIKVENNRLSVQFKNGTSISCTKFNVYTNSKKLTDAEVKGSGNLSISGNITSENLKLLVRGSGNIKLEDATTTSLHAEGHGSGNIDINGAIKTDDANITVQGSGNINIKNIDTNTLSATARGSGDIRMIGKVQTATYNVHGSGGISAKDLEAKEATCSVGGSGSVNLFATESLKADVEGSGDIRYRGKPTQLQTKVRGSGSIKNIN